MPKPIWSRLCQFSLRALFFAISGCSVALAVWKMPFETDVKDLDEFAICGMGETAESMRAYSEHVDALRERGHVYRDFHGNRIKHGVAVLYNRNGIKMRERHWSHGKLNGMQTEWESNGDIKTQIRYRDGKLHGWSRIYGDLMYYENDEPIWVESYAYWGKHVTQCHADGSETETNWSHNAEKISEVMRDAKHARQGITRFFHANGRLSCEGSWRDNHEHGTWTWWDDRGNLLREIKYNNGARQSPDGKAGRLLFVVEREHPETPDAELRGALVRESCLSSFHESLSKAFTAIEDLHSNRLEQPFRPDFRVRAREPDIQALLDNAKVIEAPTDATLSEALRFQLSPLGLEAVVHDNTIWIVSADEARAWAEATPVSRFVSDKAGRHLNYNDGLQLGRTTLQNLLDALKEQEIVMRLDEARVPDAAALVTREIDADIPGCTVGAAIDVALNQLGLTYYAANDEFVIVPCETP